MRRSFVFAFAVTLYSAITAQAQVGMPGIAYSSTVAGGDGVQLYPYDQQDPWLHGYFQRVPAYGGFASFRPYNYRHVFSQTQIASQWGSAHGMPYSQQFWNKYRSSYLDQNLHSQAMSTPFPVAQPLMRQHAVPVYPAGNVRPIGYQSVADQVVPAQTMQPAAAGHQPGTESRPVHVFPVR